ncbi:TrbC/VirB2 family protein [Helicobacter cetorum]|uniref:TrbC/VirB2 family protein n=1 Tax=Helicobacter cetorum TaxID=138563 RepID=UPI000CF0DAE1|nr:TrbC/VirB2 family protein [Helicobacter cetorum]
MLESLKHFKNQIKGISNKVNSLSLKTRLFLFSLLGLNTLYAQGFQGFTNKFFQFLQSGEVRSIVAIIIVFMFIYLIKNHDRWKEFIVLWGSILAGLIGILNARTIANWIY